MKDHHPHHPHPHPPVDEEEAEDDDGHPRTRTKMRIGHAGENPEKHDERITTRNKPEAWRDVQKERASKTSK